MPRNKQLNKKTSQNRQNTQTQHNAQKQSNKTKTPAHNGDTTQLYISQRTNTTQQHKT